MSRCHNQILAWRNYDMRGSGGGSVGRAVASDVRGPRFESSHRQTFLSDIYLFTINYIEKTKNKEKKRPRMAHLKKTSYDMLKRSTLIG